MSVQYSLIYFSDTVFVIGALFNGFFHYFIVNIGKILNKSHLVAVEFKVTAERIENAKRTRIADMDIVINGGTAGIDFHFALE